jgi:hypothetical protein
VQTIFAYRSIGIRLKAVTGHGMCVGRFREP